MERAEILKNQNLTNSSLESNFKIEEMRGSLDFRSSQGYFRKGQTDKNIIFSRDSTSSTVRTSASYRSSINSRMSEQSLDNFEKSDYKDHSSIILAPSTFNPRLSLNDFKRAELPKLLLLENSEKSKADSPITVSTEKYKYIGYLNLLKQRHGFGICYYKNGDKYTGLWQDDKKSGWGRYEFKATGKIFQGEFKENNVEGYVEYISKNGIIHQGKMKNQKFVNQELMIIHHPGFYLAGVMTFNLVLGKLTGLAKINYKNGGVYEGEIIENSECGWGITRNPDRSILRGYKTDGLPNGYCELDSPNGDRFFGHFINGKKQGLAISYTSGNYTMGKYLDDYKDGGFLCCMKGEVKFELFLAGFLIKTIEKKQDVINYINLCYPEYRWLYLANNKYLYEMINRKKDL
jgi:hypothetical protein